MSDPRSHLDAPTVHDPHGRAAESLNADLSNLPCRFASYDLLEEVARGGMGVVFRAKQVDLNRIVAIKMIINGCLADAEDIKRFQAEAESAANLDHPGIVPIYEVGEADGRHFFSMAYVEGNSLAQLLAGGPIDSKRAAEMLAQIADAVDYAHSQGVIHRDLKPGNILLCEQKRPRITDFGVAKQELSDRDITIKGELLGTPNFMPPEQARGDTDQVTAASDVYSLGAILYTMLTGRPPFQAANQLDTLNQVIHDPVIAPRKLNSRVPLDLETITLKCLEKQPSRRYASAGDVASECRAFLEGKPIQATPPSTIRILDSWFRQHMLVASMSGVTSVLLVAGLVGLAWRCRYEIENNATLQSEVLRLRQDKESLELQEMIGNARFRQMDDERLALWARQVATKDMPLALLLAAEACRPTAGVPGPQHGTPHQTLATLLRQQRPQSDLPETVDQRIQLAHQLAGRTLTTDERAHYLFQRETP